MVRIFNFNSIACSLPTEAKKLFISSDFWLSSVITIFLSISGPIFEFLPSLPKTVRKFGTFGLSSRKILHLQHFQILLSRSLLQLFQSNLCNGFLIFFILLPFIWTFRFCFLEQPVPVVKFFSQSLFERIFTFLNLKCSSMVVLNNFSHAQRQSSTSSKMEITCHGTVSRQI